MWFLMQMLFVWSWGEYQGAGKGKFSLLQDHKTPYEFILLLLCVI